MDLSIIEQSLNWNGELEKRKRTDKIILHHAAVFSASLLDIHNWHLSVGWAGIVYHFYILKDGSIYRGRPEDSIGSHALGYNESSIGICFEGNFDVDEMPGMQIEMGMELIEYLKSKYEIVQILGHSEVDSTMCPGLNFPFEKLGAHLQCEKYT